MKQKRIFYLFSSCILLAVVLALGTGYCLRALGTFLVIKDELQSADTIVVLGGESKQRVDQAVKLYKEGFSRFIIMSSNGRGSLISVAQEMKQEAVQNGVPSENIFLEPKAEHTYQHPIFVEPILRSHHFTSAIVVSSPYHMRRTAMLFDHEFHKTGIKLLYYPVMNSWFDARHWWQSNSGRRVVFSEYTKMAFNFWGTGFSDFTCGLIRRFKSPSLL